jgi:hypothetical protein
MPQGELLIQPGAVSIRAGQPSDWLTFPGVTEQFGGTEHMAKACFFYFKKEKKKLSPKKRRRWRHL